MPIACHSLSASVSGKIGAGRLADGPCICMAPRLSGPDAPSSRWKLLDRSDHHSSGRTDHLARLPPADQIATRLTQSAPNSRTAAMIEPLRYLKIWWPRRLALA